MLHLTFFAKSIPLLDALDSSGAGSKHQQHHLAHMGWSSFQWCGQQANNNKKDIRNLCSYWKHHLSVEQAPATNINKIPTNVCPYWMPQQQKLSIYKQTFDPIEHTTFR